MELKCKSYGSLCELEYFEINGINADYDDFGNKDDLSPGTAEEYGCGDMTFTPKLPTQDVLDKYSITVEEYNNVCSKLESELSYGCCGWCV